MEKKKKTVRILCCNECTAPLEIIGGKMFCPECEVTPSIQDTFIKRLCPECNVQVEESASGEEYICPNCKKVYEG